jgi:hypothetical protein
MSNTLNIYLEEQRSPAHEIIALEVKIPQSAKGFHLSPGIACLLNLSYCLPKCSHFDFTTFFTINHSPGIQEQAVYKQIK